MEHKVNDYSLKLLDKLKSMFQKEEKSKLTLEEFSG